MQIAHKVDPIDTTGAGDTFVGALLYYLDHHKQKPDHISPEMMKEGLCFANHAAAIVTTKKGCDERSSNIRGITEII